jgi:DNA-binding SARP family transcriptional activator
MTETAAMLVQASDAHDQPRHGGGMKYRVLGPVESQCQGRWVQAGQGLLGTLLAVLLSNAGQAVSTSRLLDELWQESLPPSAAKLLQIYVSRLRRMLGDPASETLVTVRNGHRAQGYRLFVGPSDMDAQQFEQVVERGRLLLQQRAFTDAAGQFAAALGLWRGAAFAGVGAANAVTAKAARLEELRLGTREDYAEALLGAGSAAQAVAELKSLTAEHPLREGAHRLLMLAMYRIGRQADALATYQRLRDTLADELGIDPDPRLSRVHQQILTADPALLKLDAVQRRAMPELKPRQLPPDSSTFTGRTVEAASLRTLLTSSGRGPLVVAVVDGIGGLGKSALANHVAHQVAEHFPDGQLYVDLRGAAVGRAPLGTSEVLGRFLRALGRDAPPQIRSVEEIAAIYRSLAASQRLLVVLDNAAAAEQIRHLIPAGPGCGVLITCRRALTSLEGVHIHLPALTDHEATALLGRLAGQRRGEAEPEAMAALVRFCAGLPLALRVAGAWLAARPELPLSTLVRRLADERTRLGRLQHDDLAVRASFLAGYQEVADADPVAARAFQFIGLLDGQEISAHTVAAGLGQTPEVAEAALSRLADAGLIRTTATGHFEVHDLMRLFAHEQAGGR